MSDFPEVIIESVVGRKSLPKFFLEPVSLPRFFQWSENVGLTFDIKLTDEELQELPSWRLFDRKITAGISSLRPEVVLPVEDIGGEVNVNTTAWIFLQLKDKNKPADGRVQRLFVPPTEVPTPSDFCLDKLVGTFSADNTISRYGGRHVPEKIIVIGT